MSKIELDSGTVEKFIQKLGKFQGSWGAVVCPDGMEMSGLYYELGSVEYGVKNGVKRIVGFTS